LPPSAPQVIAIAGLACILVGLGGFISLSLRHPQRKKPPVFRHHAAVSEGESYRSRERAGNDGAAEEEEVTPAVELLRPAVEHL
jgi:hypothetical protein